MPPKSWACPREAVSINAGLHIVILGLQQAVKHWHTDRKDVMGTVQVIWPGESGGPPGGDLDQDGEFHRSRNPEWPGGSVPEPLMGSSSLDPKGPAPWWDHHSPGNSGGSDDESPGGGDIPWCEVVSHRRLRAQPREVVTTVVGSQGFLPRRHRRWETERVTAPTMTTKPSPTDAWNVFDGGLPYCQSHSLS